MFYKQTPVKITGYGWQLVARYFTVKSTDFYSVSSNRIAFLLDQVKQNLKSFEIASLIGTLLCMMDSSYEISRANFQQCCR